MSDDKQLVSAPESTDRAKIEPLGYFKSHDAIAKKES